MSRGLFILGTGLVLFATTVTLNSWATIVDGDNQRLPFDQIQIGMNRKQVESILGSQGQFRSFNPGDAKPGPNGPVQSTVLECRWEDASETVDVQFRDSEVTNISRLPKAPLDVESLLWARLGLALLAVFGLVFLLEGLGTRSNRRFTNVGSPAPPPPA